MERTIENKVLVVTGGADGLGLEMVCKFLDKGVKVAIIIDVNEQKGVAAVAKLTEKYGNNKAVFIRCDVTSDLEVTFEKIINEYKAVDVLINNAGILNEKALRKTIEVNTLALMEWTIKFYDYMRKDRGGNGGTIINVSSIFGFRIIAHNPFYQASKFAVLGFSKSIGHEYNYKKTGVRVVVLCPGLTYTNLSEKPKARDDDSNEDLFQEVEAMEWQEVVAIGDGAIEIFKNADSGTVWLVEGYRQAVMV
ncbi:15-hydroxyprostaglandin dehydrogenase [NAD(+)]-like [Epargyreus clarus]|uniref:15-hydroxyprostaglandin dehydrogenase [NAD(+)]-like n=1 Tax=Epargyreus clarus TaxID=520877 RepID=UPI003C305E1A